MWFLVYTKSIPLLMGKEGDREGRGREWEGQRELGWSGDSKRFQSS